MIGDERVVVLVDPRLPGAPLLERVHPDDLRALHSRPVFAISEVAKVFFARTAYWIRHLESKKLLTPSGRTAKNARVWSLPDIEDMAHQLGQNSVISPAQVANAIQMVHTCASQWGFLNPDPISPEEELAALAEEDVGPEE